MPRSKSMSKASVAEKITTEETTKVSENIMKKFDKEDYIPCRSITVGALYLDGIKSKEPYLWTDYGDVSDVQYQDLVAMVRSKSNAFIYSPLIIVEDDDFINEFTILKKFYDDQYTVKELESVLDLSVNDMVATIKNLPNGARESLKNIASTQVINGKLDSVKKIKALDELFGTELNLLSSIVSEQ